MVASIRASVRSIHTSLQSLHTTALNEEKPNVIRLLVDAMEANRSVGIKATQVIVALGENISSGTDVYQQAEVDNLSLIHI